MARNKVSLDAIDSILLGGADSATENSPEETASTKRKRTKVGRPKEENYESRTFRVKKELVQKLRIIATREGRLQKDILDYALESVIARYEGKHGVIDISKDYGKKGVADIF